MYREAATIDDKKERHAHTNWARTSESRSKIDAMVHLAATDFRINIMPEHLDKDTRLFNCMNGTIDLRTGELRPHRKEDLITKLSPVNYDPDAKAPRWEQFEREVFAGDVELAMYMRRMIGYSLTAEDQVQELSNLRTVTEQTERIFILIRF